MKPKRRNGTVDLLKFLFSIMIMLFHCGRGFPGGYIAVEFFFIVSGYLMAKSTGKRMKNGLSIGKDTFSFVLHKAKGIFPVYLTAWLIAFGIHQYVINASGSDIGMALYRSPFNILMIQMCGNFDMGYRLGGSWYISAMLLAMLLIYPVRKKKPDLFDHVIAPIVVLLFSGYVYQYGKGISMTVHYLSDLYLYNGLFRAIAEISLGCFCYAMGQRLVKTEFTLPGRCIISIIELGGYVLVGWMAWKYASTDKDLVHMLVLALSVTLSFSAKGIHAVLFRGTFFSYLGQFGLCMYLTHGSVMNDIIPYLRKRPAIAEYLASSDGAYLLVYFGLTLLLSVLCYFVGKLMSRIGLALKKFVCTKLVKKADPVS